MPNLKQVIDVLETLYPLRYAEEWGLGADFIRFIEEENRFCTKCGNPRFSKPKVSYCKKCGEEILWGKELCDACAAQKSGVIIHIEPKAEKKTSPGFRQAGDNDLD